MTNRYPSINFRDSVESSEILKSPIELTVGCVIVSDYYKDGENEVQTIKDEKRFLELFTDNSHPLSGGSSISLLNAYRLSGKCILRAIRCTSSSINTAVRRIFEDDFPEIFIDLGDSRIRDRFFYWYKETDGWLYSNNQDRKVLLCTPRIFIASHTRSEIDSRSSHYQNSQVAHYFPYGINYSSLGFYYRVAPSVLYIESLLDNIKGGHRYCGVYSYLYGEVKDIDELEDDVARKDREVLYGKGYNCIYFNKNRSAYYISTNRTSVSEVSATDRESTRRLADDIDYYLFSHGESYQGRTANSLLLEEITGDIKNLMNRYKSESDGLITDYKVVCDKSINSEIDMANGYINYTLEVHLNRTSNNILIFTRYIKTNED